MLYLFGDKLQAVCRTLKDGTQLSGVLQRGRGGGAGQGYRGAGGYRGGRGRGDYRGGRGAVGYRAGFRGGFRRRGGKDKKDG